MTTHAPPLTCPLRGCARRRSTEQTLATHLVDDHQLSLEGAVNLARRTVEGMPRTRWGVPGQGRGARSRRGSYQTHHCATCGDAGHNRLTCPLRGRGRDREEAEDL